MDDGHGYSVGCLNDCNTDGLYDEEGQEDIQAVPLDKREVLVLEKVLKNWVHLCPLDQ